MKAEIQIDRKGNKQTDFQAATDQHPVSNYTLSQNKRKENKKNPQNQDK